MAIANPSGTSYSVVCIHCGANITFTLLDWVVGRESFEVSCARCSRNFDAFVNLAINSKVSDLIVLQKLSQGFQINEIAKKYGLKASAVAVRLMRLKRKTQTRTVFQLMFKFAQMGLDKFNSEGQYIGHRKARGSNQEV